MKIVLEQQKQLLLENGTYQSEIARLHTLIDTAQVDAYESEISQLRGQVIDLKSALERSATEMVEAKTQEVSASTAAAARDHQQQETAAQHSKRIAELEADIRAAELQATEHQATIRAAELQIAEYQAAIRAANFDAEASTQHWKLQNENAASLERTLALVTDERDESQKEAEELRRQVKEAWAAHTTAEESRLAEQERYEIEVQIRARELNTELTEVQSEMKVVIAHVLQISSIFYSKRDGSEPRNC